MLHYLHNLNNKYTIAYVDCIFDYIFDDYEVEPIELY